jgi:large subunit ribosomal protein L19
VSKQGKLIEEFEAKYINKQNVSFKIGDTIKIHTRVIEGQKERIQMFTGVVIAKKGSGLSETFSVYRNAYGSSMERVFLVNSPRISKIEVVRSGKVRRAKLYYLRGATGKKAKIREKIAVKVGVKVEAKAKAEVAVKEHSKEEENK